MNDNKESFRGKLVNTGLIILSVLFRVFIIIAVSGLVMMFNYVFWDFTFWLIMGKHFIAVFFVGALTICFTIASIVGMITYIIWLFTNKDNSEDNQIYWR